MSLIGYLTRFERISELKNRSEENYQSEARRKEIVRSRENSGELEEQKAPENCLSTVTTILLAESVFCN